ncbi:MAG: glycosyltransferase [Clostridia bacterium]|nr:glycosyltransferase [Clostridia bacterium]
MKVLLISIKAGFGHHSTAKAIMEYMGKQGVDCRMLDTFEYINPKLNNSVAKGYLMTTKYTPEAFGKIYSTLDKKDQKYDKYSIISILSNIISYKLKDYIADYAPDIIIGTHSFACMVMSYLKEKGHISCPTIGIVTDFTVHPFWESASLDYYVTADALLNNQMNRKGIATEKILPFGIPIKEEFSSKLAPEEARRQLGIKNKQTILIMMGSMGFGNLERTLENIDKLDFDFQILCVCGNNRKMKREIDKRKWNKDILNFGFVNNISTLMDASDFIITKPGGLTMSEALAKHLPPIIMNPIPGQEDRNMEFLVNNGAAVMVTETFPVDEALFELLNNEWRLNLLKQSVIHLGKPYATKNLCEFIMRDLWHIIN